MKSHWFRKVIFVFVIFTLAEFAFSQGLDKAIVFGSTYSISETGNITAGPDGSVNFFKPKLTKPTNSNFEYFGSEVKNSLGSAKYIFLINKSSMTATVYQVFFGGKTITINNGMPDDMETFSEIMQWELYSALSIYGVGSGL